MASDGLRLPPSSGEAKSPKGRTRLVQHAVRQRRLHKRRQKEARQKEASEVRKKEASEVRQKEALLTAASVDKKEGSL